jgi:hypothetical protein
VQGVSFEFHQHVPEVQALQVAGAVVRPGQFGQVAVAGGDGAAFGVVALKIQAPSKAGCSKRNNMLKDAVMLQS